MKIGTRYIGIILILLTVIISGCSNKDDKKVEKKEEPVATEEVVEEEEEKEDVMEEEEEEPKTGEVDFGKIIKDMEERTEGEATVIYESDEKHKHELDGVDVSLDGYTLVELDDFHTNYSIPFNDSTDGGVLLAHYTIDNKTGEDVYYQPNFDISYSGATKVFKNNKDLMEEEIRISTKIGPSNDYELDKDETVKGYYAYPIGPEALQEMLDLGTIDIEVKPAAESYDPDTYEYKPLIGKESVFRISLSEEGESKNEVAGAFYEDDATTKDMGTKEMIKEKEDINETVAVGDSDVTLQGYQFTEFTPNEVEAPRFENFENGVVLLTIKTEIENKQDDVIGLSSLSAGLDVNNGSQLLLKEGLLMMYRNDDVIEPGETGEWLIPFIMDKEQYDKIWKEKEFELEVGPMLNEDAKDISKGKRAKVILPE